jgi:hypothetical protein
MQKPSDLFLTIFKVLGQMMMMNHKIRKFIAMLKLSRSAFCLHYEISEEHVRMQKIPESVAR